MVSLCCRILVNDGLDSVLIRTIVASNFGANVLKCSRSRMLDRICANLCIAVLTRFVLHLMMC